MAKSKSDFFATMAAQGLALAYEDVQLVPQHSAVEPSEVDVTSLFSRNVPLFIPLVSAAMDRVTEHCLAIVMASYGGLGVIHKNFAKPEDQAKEVARVKYHINGLIDDPRCVRDTQTLAEIMQWRERKQFDFWTFPVIDGNERLVGILSGKDFLLHPDKSGTAREAMHSPVAVAAAGTDIHGAYRLMQAHRCSTLPVVDGDRRVIGLYILKDVERNVSQRDVKANIDTRGQLRVGAAIGVGEKGLRAFELLRENRADVVVIDTAHADTKAVIDTVHEIKRNYPVPDLVAGNIAQRDAAARLIDAGVDGIKVGVGPGSICTTRLITGAGVPQLTAVYECAAVSNVPVCADGGVKYSGHVVMALAAGAHSVMMGNMLAGTDEAPGEIIYDQGLTWKEYRGMGSLGAMKEHGGERYRQKSGKPFVPEGVEGRVPYKGSAADIIELCIGGVRDGMGYVGAATIEELQTRSVFVRITPAGQAEAHPSGIKITRQAPNYRRSES